MGRDGGDEVERWWLCCGRVLLLGRGSEGRGWRRCLSRRLLPMVDVLVGLHFGLMEEAYCATFAIECRHCFRWRLLKPKRRRCWMEMGCNVQMLVIDLER